MKINPHQPWGVQASLGWRKMKERDGNFLYHLHLTRGYCVFFKCLDRNASSAKKKTADLLESFLISLLVNTNEREYFPNRDVHCKHSSATQL